MERLKSSTLDPIKAVPGLFISDRFAASSVPNLQSHNIRRVLSLLQPHEALKPKVFAGNANEADGSEGPFQIEFRTIEIDDDPTVDIVQHLSAACDWIQEGLGTLSKDNAEPSPGVLVHCRQGISRSGAIVVAYLMRNFQISYSAALSLARESRPIICPNQGFGTQLRAWEHCKYDIYLDVEDEAGSNRTKEKKEKPPYKAWKAQRDDLLAGGEEDTNKVRFSSLASAAATLGKRRLENLEKQTAK
ncbi:hypothetical protein LTR10_016857 [Elasticomyces elasticus]|uniref:Protein-tyrosine-phosphatase n=1 Tax=Exophiala sideris TaxID=1016849 RepID=A0ABR0JKA9_9EURO|nr:hypothetical protein LTR10_016857 [Elasticomyces elasticus]KAK5035373.1 hypothetical protein LTS07_002810 [Exophiala sideris]KAK5039276.1 hypothetical protein LTR13_003532 [Exophiala sideris]KAK5066297.1 hypothetical protein LTR69_002816 [Exophiala sideris]KAK5186974.1 hypothetical protein LTR44_000981 [Eurotiomycetes sp. CCFEE 6388]